MHGRFKKNTLYPMKKIILALTTIGLSWFLIHSAVIITDGLSDDVHPVDLMVVFGNEVTPEGKPSKRLQARLDEALKISQGHWTPAILVSGGTGKEGFNEADVMATYLKEHGIEKEKIIIDSQGLNTRKTAQNTARYLKGNDLDSIMIISQYFHISRARLAFEKEGIKNIASSHARYFEIRDLYSITREFFAYYWYLTK